MKRHHLGEFRVAVNAQHQHHIGENDCGGRIDWQSVQVWGRQVWRRLLESNEIGQFWLQRGSLKASFFNRSESRIGLNAI